jgi:trans-aconitate methyltransferase
MKKLKYRASPYDPNPIMITLNPALFELPQDEVKRYGLQALTYGSLTEKGLKAIIKHLELYVNQIDGFDLGCGDGELIYHLQTQMPDSKWEGVEISQHRIEQQKRDVQIWQGDMLKESYKPYNVLHADNLCLDDYTADLLEQKIVDEFSGIYMTYRIPQNMIFLKKAKFLETVLAETTWSQNGYHPIHYYYL